ncbi:MAG: hypothetical protein ACJARW_001757 [Methylophilaceae bacterium]|jgi:hypothetical protein
MARYLEASSESLKFVRLLSGQFFNLGLILYMFIDKETYV